MLDEQALLHRQEQAHEPHEPSHAEVATMIADHLGEKEETARQEILRIVKALGRTQSRTFLSYALQMEEHGGMMTANGSRRRTVGGIFFHLAYTMGKPKQGMVLQKPVSNRTPKKERKKNPELGTPRPEATPKAKQPAPQPAIAFTWDERLAAIQEAETEKGTATVKITLVGRPGKIVDRGQCIVTVMEDSKAPSLPKGLPIPTSAPTKYAVYVSAKQWAKVKDAIADPEDVLIIEGFPKTDPEVTAIAVFTTNVTTKKLQAAQRKQKAE